MIVDDNPSIREIVVEALHAFGYPVVEAADGQEALDLAQISQPSLILLDLNLPVVSGFSVVEALREHGIAPPILLVTADPRAAQVALDEQVVGYLSKPLDLDTLIGAVTALVDEP